MSCVDPGFIVSHPPPLSWNFIILFTSSFMLRAEMGDIWLEIFPSVCWISEIISRLSLSLLLLSYGFLSSFLPHVSHWEWEMGDIWFEIFPSTFQISEIISRFERKGFKLVAIKVAAPSKAFAQKHYHDLKERPFFNGLCDFLSSGPVVAMVRSGNIYYHER